MKKDVLRIFVSVFIFLLVLECLQLNNKRKQEKKEYYGIVIDIFADETNRNEYVYSIKTSRGFLKENAKLYPQSIDYVEIGDSIIKRQGAKELVIKKKNTGYKKTAIFI